MDWFEIFNDWLGICLGVLFLIGLFWFLIDKIIELID